MHNGVQIQSDGKVVWINGSDGCNIGRFCKNGIDIHHSAAKQIELGHQCLDCKAGPCTAADWDHFKDGLWRVYGVSVSDNHMPNYLKLELVS